jgi:hypothetical protein
VILSIMLPIYSALDQVPLGIDPTFSKSKIINLGLSGGMMLAAFYSRQLASPKSSESV